MKLQALATFAVAGLALLDSAVARRKGLRRRCTGEGTGTTDPAPIPTSSSAPASGSTGDGSKVFGGSNLYYAAGTSKDERATLFGAMKDANMKVLRVWLDGQTNGNTKGTNIQSFPSLEHDGVGKYDDTVLNLMDEVMLDAHDYGIKLMISFYSFNSLNGNDVYNNAYGVDGFYTRQDAQSAYDNRIKYVMSHNHTSLGKPWSQLSDYIFAFETQNEAMIGLGMSYIQNHQQWQCDRAKTIKSALNGNNGILVTTGGESWMDESVMDGWLNCPELDIVAIHAYGNGDFDQDQIQKYIQRGQAAGKKMIFQEWGVCAYNTDKNQNCDSGSLNDNRGSVVQQWANNLNSVGISWLYWQVLPNADPHWGGDFEIGIGDNGWDELKKAAQDARGMKGAFDFSGYLLP